MFFNNRLGENMKNSRLFVGFLASASTFSFSLLAMQSLRCKLFSASCYDNPITFVFPEIAYLALTLIIIGLIVNIPFFIACIKFRSAILHQKKLLLLIATLGPLLLTLLLFFSVPQMQLADWLYVLAVPCAGLLGGYALLWVHSKQV